MHHLEPEQCIDVPRQRELPSHDAACKSAISAGATIHSGRERSHSLAERHLRIHAAYQVATVRRALPAFS